MKFNMDIEKDFSIKQAFINLFTKKKKKKTEYFSKITSQSTGCHEKRSIFC